MLTAIMNRSEQCGRFDRQVGAIVGGLFEHQCIVQFTLSPLRIRVFATRRWKTLPTWQWLETCITLKQLFRNL